MIFKSLGIATATNSVSNSEDSKPVTIRLTDSEVQLYDAVAKSMGLTRQDFLAHLIRNNFKQALTDFLIGYTQGRHKSKIAAAVGSFRETLLIFAPVHHISAVRYKPETADRRFPGHPAFAANATNNTL